MKTAFLSILIFLFMLDVILLTLAIADITKPEKPLSEGAKIMGNNILNTAPHRPITVLRVYKNVK